MYSTEIKQNKQVCRLCCYETTDTVNIYSDKGKEFDYEGKINKYLYLYVGHDDNLPKTICWMCTQHLETFHKFYEKINEIQQSTLKENYISFVLKPIYEKTTYEYIDESDLKQSKSISSAEATIKESHNDENNLVEVLYVTDEFEYEQENENQNQPEHEEVIENVEEYEYYEVEQAPNQVIKQEVIGIPSTSVITVKQSQEQQQSIDLKVHPFTRSRQRIQDITDKKDNTQLLTEQLETTRTTRQTVVKESPTKIEKFKKPQKGTPDKKIETNDSIKRKTKVLNKPHSKQVESNNDTNDHNKVRKKKKPNNNVKVEEGDSEDEFPSRDSDNEDWPNQQTLDEFPNEILQDGLLLIKGQKLMSLICKFYNLVCDLCVDKTRFRHLKDLFAHYTSTHNEPGYLVCCQTKFSRYPAIIMHMARHLQPDAFRCDVCGYMVTRPRFLESHKLTHLPEEEKPFHCEHCPRSFCWKGALQIHMISHQPADKRRLYICHVCGKSYDTPGGLSTHKKMIHCDKKQQQSNVCDVCAKNFATRTGLHEHMSTIHQPREKDQVQCNDCGKWLMNNRCLKSHMILHSNVEYNCDLCDYSTKKKVLLNRHQLTQHSDAKPYTCNLCNKSFKLKRALTVHSAQHNSNKKFECPFCARVFNSSTNFYSHRKNAHPQELAEMRNKELETQRRKRIAAGIEDALDEKYVLTESTDDNLTESIEISDENLILTTTSGQEITIITVENEEEINEKLSIPVDIVDANGTIVSKSLTELVVD